MDYQEFRMMTKYYLLMCLLLHYIVTILGQSCQDEILKISTAGQIQITNEYVTVGQSVIITCSTKCAWNWHTVIIDGDVIDAASFTGNNDYEINRTNEILNCQDCNEPDDVDCSNDSQGPVQSVLNITLLAVGDHYIQCIAHLFDPNSDLWPSNRILSVPSRMLKITGTEVDTQDETLSSSITTITGVLSSLLLLTPSVKPSSSSSIATVSERLLPSLSPSVKSSSNSSNSIVSQSCNSIISQSLVTRTETATINTRTVIQRTMSTVNTVRLSTITPSVTMNSFTANSNTSAINAQMTVDTRSSCDCLVNTENIIVIVTLGILAVICLSLTLVIMVLIHINRRTVALYNQVYLDFKQNNFCTNISEGQRELDK